MHNPSYKICSQAVNGNQESNGSLIFFYITPQKTCKYKIDQTNSGKKKTKEKAPSEFHPAEKPDQSALTCLFGIFGCSRCTAGGGRTSCRIDK